MTNCVITIDGPAGSGKSTVAKILAKRLGFGFLDTGAMYRAVTVAAMRAGIDIADKDALRKVLDSSDFDFSTANGTLLVRLNGNDITEQLRDQQVTEGVSKVAPIDFVRDKLVEMQRAFAAATGAIITEGRDQGTVVFPDAKVKFFLTAAVAERAKRRCQELKAKGVDADINEIEKAIAQRDLNDSQRQIAPLRKADDAIEIDTTGLDIEGVVNKLLEISNTVLTSMQGFTI